MKDTCKYMSIHLSGRKWEFPSFAVFLLITLCALPSNVHGQMNVGFNFWSLDWGSSSAGDPKYNYFAHNVNWTTTTNPWNPTFIAEIQQAQAKCLRFMDWGVTNSSTVASWSQRIAKTANHYTGATLPQTGGGQSGVAYEWMIDLCNRVNADLWVCVPHMTDANYSNQLATLIKNNLNANLKVYVEYSNECWNDGFNQTGWLDAQRNINGLANPLKWNGKNIYGFGNGGDCRWSEYVYFACKTMNEFNKVFGDNSSRVVKVLSGQAGWGGGGSTNDMCEYHMACSQSPICNPWGVKIDAYAIAPYWNASEHTPLGTEASMRASLADCVHFLDNTQTALTGSGIPLICYEGGPDNFSIESISNSPFQEQLTLDALNAFQAKVQGIFIWYTLIGQVWGLKVQVGDDPSVSPKWRGYMTWLNTSSTSPASITVEPSNDSIFPGSTASFSVSAIGTTPVSYQWRKNGVVIAGDTASTLTLFNVQAIDNNAKYSVIVKNAFGADTSRDAILIVKAFDGLQIQKTSGAPVMDGSESAQWQGVAPQSVAHALAGAPSSAADFSVQFKALWDASNLYVFVKISDGIAYNSATVAYQNDGMEIYVDGDNSKGSSYDANDIQYRIVRGKVALEASDPSKTTGVVVVQKEIAGGYSAAFTIPWTTIGTTAVASKLMGLEVHAFDNDGTPERKTVLAWAGTTDNAWNTPSAFGTAKLSDATTRVMHSNISSVSTLTQSYLLASLRNGVVRDDRIRSMALYDMSGRLMWQSSQTHTSSMPYLNKGIFLCRVIQSNGVSNAFNFVNK